MALHILAHHGLVGRLGTPIEARHLGPRSSHELLVYVACGLLHIYSWEVAKFPWFKKTRANP